MAKKPVKKSATKKGGPTSKTRKSKAVKKTGSGKTTRSVSVKKPISEKERVQRAANLIANTEKKKTVKGRKADRPERSLTRKQTTTLLDAVVEGMQEKKAKNIAILDLTDIESRVCDYFVICDADSKTHVDAIGGSVEEVVEKMTGEKPYHSEGYQNS
jgi:uncharacterized protein (UPF0262 family)